jgi:hypothetical protein
METSQTNNPVVPSFETVWAALQETDRMMKENAERQKESTAEFNRRLGALTNLFGEFTEAMVAPALCEKFRDFGFNFQKINRNVGFMDKNKILMEVDIILENGEKAMLIEIKTKLTMDKINYHLDRLEKMRTYADLHGDKRKFLGGIAGVVVPDEERAYALNQGLYLIEPAGNTFNITVPKENPKEW